MAASNLLRSPSWLKDVESEESPASEKVMPSCRHAAMFVSSPRLKVLPEPPELRLSLPQQFEST